MATTCRKCGARLPEGLLQCPSCLAIVKPEGFLQRLFAGFKARLQGPARAVPTSPAGPQVNIRTTVRRTYKIRDARTDEVKEYRSLDEVPAPYREKLAQALEKAQALESGPISFTGPDGVAHRYRSIEEVPADIRALIERAEKGPDAK